jgi:hypothetical protein
VAELANNTYEYDIYLPPVQVRSAAARFKQGTPSDSSGILRSSLGRQILFIAGAQVNQSTSTSPGEKN